MAMIDRVDLKKTGELMPMAIHVLLWLLIFVIILISPEKQKEIADKGLEWIRSGGAGWFKK